jgi:hypothetical protein
VYVGAIAYGYDGFGSSVLRAGSPTKNFHSSSTATIPNGSTSVTVNHDLYTAPAAADIAVTATNNLGSAAKFWISNVTETTFWINVNANPGAATATFVWKAQVV